MRMAARSAAPGAAGSRDIGVTPPVGDGAGAAGQGPGDAREGMRPHRSRQALPGGAHARQAVGGHPLPRKLSPCGASFPFRRSGREPRVPCENAILIGRQALGEGLEGLLPWDFEGNRAFLRSLHGLSLCLWREDPSRRLRRCSGSSWPWRDARARLLRSSLLAALLAGAVGAGARTRHLDQPWLLGETAYPGCEPCWRGGQSSQG